MSFDQRDFRNALGTFGTGVTIISTRGLDGRAYGMTANSFSGVSLDPPLVLWSLAMKSPNAAAFRSATHFGVSILALDQLALSRQFSRPAPDKFEGVATVAGAGGVPLIAGAAARFECRTEYCCLGGDHLIIVGRVAHYAYERKSTLLFCQGRYQRGQELEPAADANQELATAWSGLA